MTPANIITMVRICLVPVFVVAIISPWPEWIGFVELDVWKAWIAAGIFVVISCTDWLDGYLARKRNEVTDFGKFMDPLADKILVTAALLVLIELGALPSWVVLLIVAREFIVSGVRMVAGKQGGGYRRLVVRQVQDCLPDDRHRAFRGQGKPGFA